MQQKENEVPKEDAGRGLVLCCILCTFIFMMIILVLLSSGYFGIGGIYG